MYEYDTKQKSITVCNMHFKAFENISAFKHLGTTFLYFVDET